MLLIHAFPPASLHKTQIVSTVKTKRLLTNSFKTEVLPFSRNSIMEDIISSTINGFQAINNMHRTPIWLLASLMKTPPLQVAIISTWRQSVSVYETDGPSSTHVKFSVHSRLPAAEVLPDPLYVMSLCKSANAE